MCLFFCLCVCVLANALILSATQGDTKVAIKVIVCGWFLVCLCVNQCAQVVWGTQRHQSGYQSNSVQLSVFVCLFVCLPMHYTVLDTHRHQICYQGSSVLWRRGCGWCVCLFFACTYSWFKIFEICCKVCFDFWLVLILLSVILLSSNSFALILFICFILLSCHSITEFVLFWSFVTCFKLLFLSDINLLLIFMYHFVPFLSLYFKFDHFVDFCYCMFETKWPLHIVQLTESHGRP